MSSQRGDRVEVGIRMREARERARVPIAEAALAAGVQPMAVQRWERGAAMPSLIEFRELLGLYGVTACELLFADNPMEFNAQEAAELARVARGLSPAMQTRVDCLLAVLARGVEPVWRVRQ